MIRCRLAPIDSHGPSHVAPTASRIGAPASGRPDHPTSQAPRPRPRRGLATRCNAGGRSPRSLSTDVRIALRTCGPRGPRRDHSATATKPLNAATPPSTTTRARARDALTKRHRDDNGWSDLNAGTDPEPGDRARKAHRRTYRFTYRPTPRSMSRRWRCGRYMGREVGV